MWKDGEHLLCDKAAEITVNVKRGLFEELWLGVLLCCVEPAHKHHMRDQNIASGLELSIAHVRKALLMHTRQACDCNGIRTMEQVQRLLVRT